MDRASTARRRARGAGDAPARPAPRDALCACGQAWRWGWLLPGTFAPASSPNSTAQASSLSETLSTLNFGKGVTEITLGAARKNTEPGAVFEARDAAGRHEREAAAARVALAERSARCEELEGEVEALHLALAAANRMAAEGRAAAAAERSGGEGGGGIPAFRPATGEAPAGRRAAEAGPGAAPVTSAAPGPARTAASAPPPPEGLGKAAAGRMLPAMAKLNLGRLIEGEGSPASQASGRSPLLAGAGVCGIRLGKGEWGRGLRLSEQCALLGALRGDGMDWAQEVKRDARASGPHHSSQSPPPPHNPPPHAVPRQQDPRADAAARDGAPRPLLPLQHLQHPPVRAPTGNPSRHNPRPLCTEMSPFPPSSAPQCSPMSARGQSGESRRASLTGDGGPGALPSSRLSSGRSVAPRVDTGRGAGVRAAPGAPLASRTSSGGSVMAPLSSRTSSSRRWA